MENPKRLKPGTKIIITGFDERLKELAVKLFPDMKFPLNATSLNDYGTFGDSVVKLENGKTCGLAYFDFEK